MSFFCRVYTSRSAKFRFSSVRCPTPWKPPSRLATQWCCGQPMHWEVWALVFVPTERSWRKPPTRSEERMQCRSPASIKAAHYWRLSHYYQVAPFAQIFTDRPFPSQLPSLPFCSMEPAGQKGKTPPNCFELFFWYFARKGSLQLPGNILLRDSAIHFNVRQLNWF